MSLFKRKSPEIDPNARIIEKVIKKAEPSRRQSSFVTSAARLSSKNKTRGFASCHFQQFALIEGRSFNLVFQK